MKTRKTYEELFNEHSRRLVRRRVTGIILIPAIMVLSGLTVWYAGNHFDQEQVYVDTEGNVIEDPSLIPDSEAR